MLTEVYVAALSMEAYQVACSRDSVLETWLSKDRKILRLGAVHAFLSDELPLNGHATSTETQKSFKFRLDMVEPVLQGFAQRGTTRFIVTADFVSSTLGSEEATDEEAESDQECIEIDEGFLASSTLTRFLSPPNGHHSSTPGVSNDSDEALPSQPYFQTHPLSEPENIADEHCTLYLRTADLGKVGILNGDWVSTWRDFGEVVILLILLGNGPVS